MRWATRAGVHIDRAACAWLIRRFVDPAAEFLFVGDATEVPADATAFDMRGVELGHVGGDCSFETILRRYELTDQSSGGSPRSCTSPTSTTTASTPRSAGPRRAARGLSMTGTDEQTLAVSGPLFDGLYEYHRRRTLLGREPA